MRNFLRRTAAGMMIGALLCTNAGAVSASVASKVPEATAANGKYTINTADSGITLKSGQEYVLLVAKGSYTQGATSVNIEIDASTLTYIDQATATDTSLTFDFIPKLATNSVILLGGDFGNVQSPVVIGYITSNGETIDIKVPVSDNVLPNSTTDQAGDITIEVVGGDTSDDTTSDGTVSVAIPSGGAVTIKIHRPGYISLTINNYTPNANIDSYLAKFTECAGDITEDGDINITDIQAVLNDYGKANPTMETADVNRDGDINVRDIQLILNNFYVNAEKMTFTMP